MEVQARFDQTHLQELEEFAQFAATVPTDTLPLVLPLAPARQRVDTFRLAWAMELSIERRHGFAITVRLINLGYEARFGVRQSKAARIELQVEQVPVAAAQLKS